MNEEKVIVSEMSVNTAAETSKSDIWQIKADLKAPPLPGKRIALSSSDAENFPQLGLSPLHLVDLMIEINRYLLAAGASIVYGGDLRPNGLTQMLIELVDRYKFINQPQADRLYSYLSFPVGLSLSEEDEARYAHRISFIRADVPDDLHEIDAKTYIPPIGAQNLFVWARCLTHMREQMERNCDARIFIAGAAKVYKGRAPGILEELLTSLKHRTPIYLIGSYGGVVGDVVGHLNGKDSLRRLLAGIQGGAGFSELKQVFEEHNIPEGMNWPDELLNHVALDWDQISEMNGLTVAENKILSGSTHVQEIIYYLLKGVVNSKKRHTK